MSVVGLKAEDEKQLELDIKLRLLLCLFLAQRGAAAPIDPLLAAKGFGRSHYRALVFTELCPGIKVGELAGILRITLQSLNRVLSPLVKQGYIGQQSDADDLRVRRLFLMPKGRKVVQSCLSAQGCMLDSALQTRGAANLAGIVGFLCGVMDKDDRQFFEQFRREMLERP
jgi:DNA-binding MarR family transcriptional regulator